MADQLNEWWKLVKFPTCAKAPLGFGSEYWNPNPTVYEGWEQLRDRHLALGRTLKKRELANELARNLLDDVLVSAGGVESAILRIRKSTSELQEYDKTFSISAHLAGVPHSLVHSASTDLWYAFADVLSWSRTLVERLERRAEDSKRFPKQGLIPAIRPKRLKKRCERLLIELRSGPVGRARPLANFMLHTALVAHPFSGVEVDSSGRITLAVPDDPGKSVKHWYLLTWDQQRDGLVVADEIWEVVRAFVAKLIEAFQKGIPKRIRV